MEKSSNPQEEGKLTFENATKYIEYDILYAAPAKPSLITTNPRKYGPGRKNTSTKSTGGSSKITTGLSCSGLSQVAA